MQRKFSVIRTIAAPTTLIPLDKYSDSQSSARVLNEKFSKDEERNLYGCETSAVLDIEPLETKESSNFYYVCDVCSEVFAFQSSLATHYQSHTEKPQVSKIPLSSTSSPELHEDGNVQISFSCEHCNKVFTRKYTLMQHFMNMHHGINAYACNQCNSSFNSRIKLLNHSKTHKIDTEKMNYACKICGKILLHHSSWRRHTRGHNGEKPYACKQCHMTFTLNSSLKRHKKKHIKTSKKYKQRHKQFLKTSKSTDAKKDYECDICSKILHTERSLNYHYIRKHLGTTPFACDQCSETFVIESDLIAHCKTHPDEHFVCDFCNKSFYIKYQLKQHMQVHTRATTFSCNNCNKTFSTRASLNQHRKSHSGRYYSCNVCDKKFSYPGNLKVHMTVHTGQKPFSCVQCNKAFANTSNLKVHNKMHHPELLQEAT